MNITNDTVVMVLGTLSSVVPATPVDEQNTTNAEFVAVALRSTARLVDGTQLPTEDRVEVCYTCIYIYTHTHVDL